MKYAHQTGSQIIKQVLLGLFIPSARNSFVSTERMEYVHYVCLFQPNTLKYKINFLHSSVVLMLLLQNGSTYFANDDKGLMQFMVFKV